MTDDQTFASFDDDLGAFIRRTSGGSISRQHRPATHPDGEFNRLALALYSLQYEHNAPYQRFCQRRRISPASVTDWRQIPCVPTSAFKELELTSLPAPERTGVFHSSGTSEQPPSRHFHSARSLALYEASLLPWFQTHLVPEWNVSPDSGRRINGSPVEHPAFLCLTPPPASAPHSSLVRMFDTMRRNFGSCDFQFTGLANDGAAWELDHAAIQAALERAMQRRQPLVLLGTAFSYVHLLDHLAANGLRFELPAGSRALETGGYKGRSRTMSRHELHAFITEHLGIPQSRIVCEYGMSELSSQAYDTVAEGTDRSAGANLQPSTFNLQSEPKRRIFRFPPWARVQVISPETGHEAGENETGLIRVWDLANAWSVMAIQTEDLGIRRGNGFELLGRAALAEPRGCSLMTV